MSDRRDKERLFRQSEGTPRAAPYVGILPSGETVQGTKAAIQEMHAAIWRAEPTTTCTGQTYRDFAERCDRARQEAEQRAVDAIAALEAAAGSAGTGAAPPDAELERLGAVAVEYYRTRRVVRDELAAVHRSGKLSYSYEMPSWKRECDAERELEIAARTFLERGGAAQPPPSAPSLGLGNALAEAVKEFLLALAAQEEADDWADNLDGSADEDADNEAERDAVVATRRVQAAERRLKVARENWVSGVPREETKP